MSDFEIRECVRNVLYDDRLVMRVMGCDEEGRVKESQGEMENKELNCSNI